MADICVKYAGLNLRSPLIAGSCGLNRNPQTALKFQEAGAGAIILPSLFEEQIELEIDSLKTTENLNAYTEGEEMLAYFQKQHAVEEYLSLIKNMKKTLSIPVIASINCYRSGSWMEFAHRIAAAGADALELNIFYLPSDPDVEREKIRQTYLDIARKMVKEIDLPVTLKVSYYFDNVAASLRELSFTGINGLVLFNRFYSPDIDIEKIQMTSSDAIKSSTDFSIPLRWTGILSGKLDCDICTSTGVAKGQDLVKMLLAGANAVQMTSVLYRQGDTAIKNALHFLKEWMQKHNYATIEEFRGKLSQENLTDAGFYERVQFIKFFTEHK